MVEFSLEALDALSAIREDERFTLDAANAMARKIVARCNLLDKAPHGGYRGRVSGTWEVLVHPFVVVFDIMPRGARIISIWHGRQDRMPLAVRMDNETTTFLGSVGRSVSSSRPNFCSAPGGGGVKADAKHSREAVALTLPSTARGWGKQGLSYNKRPNQLQLFPLFSSGLEPPKNTVPS